MRQPDPAPGFLTIGQPAARAMALGGAARHRLDRTLLVHGPPGAGKGAFVADLLALLLCGDDAAPDRPCNRCPGCRRARDGSHADLVVGSYEQWREERSAGESIVSAARRWLLSAAGAPVAGERRVVLIEGVDRAGEQIQNALLKALEEPSPRHVFVLVADDLDRVLPTIRSRSQALRIGAVPRGELSAWLVDHERLPAEQADELALLAEGLPGRAVGFARNAELLGWRRRVQQELLTLLAAGRADRFASARDLLAEAGRMAPAEGGRESASGEEATASGARAAPGAQRAAALLLIDAWISLARDLLVTASGRADLAVGRGTVDGLDDASSAADPQRWGLVVRFLETAAEGLRQNGSPRLALEAAMLHWPTREPERR